MPVQHEAGAVAGAGQAGVDVVTAIGHPALVDVEAEFAQLGSVVLADFCLVQGHAGDFHQSLRLAGDPFAIDRVFEGCPLLLVLFHLHPLLSLLRFRLSWSYHSMAIPRFKRGRADRGAGLGIKEVCCITFRYSLAFPMDGGIHRIVSTMAGSRPGCGLLRRAGRSPLPAGRRGGWRARRCGRW